MKEIKPSRKQKEWLTPELLHRAPAATFISIRSEPWVQLDHPLGGPLTCVRSPYKNAVGVTRIDDKWYWVMTTNLLSVLQPRTPDDILKQMMDRSAVNFPDQSMER